MELGATICTPRSPACLACPLAQRCAARRTGRQDELPRVAPKKPPARLGVDAALVVRGGRWLVARRAAAVGLFGGLWELPELGALEGAVAVGEPLAEHVHQLTHRTIRYRVYRADLRGRPRPGSLYDATKFISPATLSSLGVSSATLRLAERLRSTEWQTPKAR